MSQPEHPQEGHDAAHEHMHLEPQTFEQAVRDYIKNAPFMVLSIAFHGLIALLLWLFYVPSQPVKKEDKTITMVVQETTVDPIKLEPPPPVEAKPIEEDENQIDDPLATSSEEGTVDVDVPTPDVGTNTETQTNDSLYSGESYAPFDGNALHDLIGVGGGGGGRGGGKYGKRGGAKGTGKAGGKASQKAVDYGLEWLHRHQDDDGHWSSHDFAAHCTAAKCTGEGEMVHDIGCTGLALLAFLGAGNTPNSGKYKNDVKKGLKYLVEVQDKESGCFGQPNSHSSFIYDHALATLSMTEGFGLSQWPTLKEPAQKGLNFINAARNPYKAWRYTYPPNGDNDMSVTGWMVMCLKSAEDFGLNVDHAGLDGAKLLIDEMTDENSWRTGYIQKGGLSAREPRAEEKWPAAKTESITAVALLCRIFMGEEPDKSAAVKGGADRLLKQLPLWDEKEGTIDFYYWYYGSYAMYQIGGSEWDKWQQKMLDAVVKSQRQEGCEQGSWDPQYDPWGARGGRVYSTAIMTLCMEVYYRYDRVLGAR